MFRALKNLSGLLVLVLYVCSAPTPCAHKCRNEIIQSVEDLLTEVPKKRLQELVPRVKLEECKVIVSEASDYFDQWMQSMHKGIKHLCEVQLVLETLNYEEFGKNGTIVRALNQYNQQFQKNCSMPNRDEEVELEIPLRKLKECMQRINSQPELKKVATV